MMLRPSGKRSVSEDNEIFIVDFSEKCDNEWEQNYYQHLSENGYENTMRVGAQWQ